MKIVKRDKSTEEFDIQKITRVVTVAGLTPAQAEQLTKNVENWLKENFTDSVPSDMVREKVINELHSFNQRAEDLFKWYEGTKDKK
jgi:transcriptional regulator NrdR family protein